MEDNHVLLDRGIITGNDTHGEFYLPPMMLDNEYNSTAYLVTVQIRIFTSLEDRYFNLGILCDNPDAAELKELHKTLKEQQE